MSNAPRSTTIRDQHRRAIRRTKPPCGICGEPIDYNLPHMDPMQFVVDHIVPLARGGTDDLDNLQAAHRSCNLAKADHLPQEANRRVLLICGPPGAGKTTLARASGLTVYDIDDPQWNDDEPLFQAALRSLAQNQSAQAAVIRSGATVSARTKAAGLCGATEVRVVDTELPVCIERIISRARSKQPIRAQVAAAHDWWNRYEPGPVVAAGLALTGEQSRAFVTSRSW